MLILVSICAAIANQFAATGRVAIGSFLVAALGGVSSWCLRGWWHAGLEENDTVAELTRELDALRLAAATQAAGTTALPLLSSGAWGGTAQPRIAAGSPLPDLHRFLTGAPPAWHAIPPPPPTNTRNPA